MRIASYVMFTMDIDEARIVLRAIGKEKHLKADRSNPSSNLRFQALELFT